MNTTMFFITARKGDAKLGEVAAGVFRALGVSEWEERDSSNCPPDDHYFAGYCENAEVTVYDADDERTPDYPFRVSLEDSSWRKGPGVIVTDVECVANALVAGGFTVFVPAGPWERIDWDGDGNVYAA
jgi:hypothetical protein